MRYLLYNTYFLNSLFSLGEQHKWLSSFFSTANLTFAVQKLYISFR